MDTPAEIAGDELVRRQKQRDHILSDAVAAIRESGAIMQNGHFYHDRGLNVMHGRRWIKSQEFLRNPFLSLRIMQGLVGIIPDSVKEQVEVVAGPFSGGALIAKEMANLLSSSSKDMRVVEFCPISVDKNRGYRPGDVYYVTPTWQKCIEGKKVMLIDDTSVTGEVIKKCARALKGVESIVAIGLIIDQGRGNLFKVGDKSFAQVPRFSVLRLDPETLYAKEECPMCEAAIPITRF